MTRRQLGNALAIALQETDHDLDEAAITIARLATKKKRKGRSDRRLGADVEREVSPRCIAELAAVAAEQGISPHALVRGRGNLASWMRFEAAWRCRQLTPPATYNEIAAALDMSDHTSAMYAVRKWQARLDAARGAERDGATGP